MRGLAEALHLAVPSWSPKMEGTLGSFLEPWYLPHGQDPPAREHWLAGTLTSDGAASSGGRK